ncbi:MAG: glycosyltransferase [Phycisphaerales bacterium]|nr:glycosyltransferase [Phycisphaerales bacterium]
MRILMLGWEFPPFMAGGLGTAVEGLTRSLVKQGHEVVFILPQPVPEGHQSHVELIGPRVLAQRAKALRTGAISPQPASGGADPEPMDPAHQRDPQLIETLSRRIEEFESSYPSSYPGVDVGNTLTRLIEEIRESRAVQANAQEALRDPSGFKALQTASATQIADAFDALVDSVHGLGTGDSGYGSDLFGDAQRYARLVAALGLTEKFDVIHAHDWLTYQAGLLLKQITGKPLVCHIHATEFDRSGEHINQGVYDIERAGMQGADRVVAVSRLTKAIVHAKYGVEDSKIDVVYNGVAQHDAQPQRGAAIERDERIVLFLGRITMQKGPEYFIEAAKRVLEKEEKVKFVVAGSGDMAVRMIEHAASIGIGHKVLFTGFLRGRDVDRVYQMADCYVMPSVSEPFGIAPLEAMRNDVPVIVSKQSGVSEVLTHALKVDFWDTDEMANKIVAVLRYPPLGQTLREHGRFELRGLNWDGAAEKCVKVYGRAIASL